MNTKLDKIFAEISAGELVDKITILEIKKENIKNTEKLSEINKELESLRKTFIKSINLITFCDCGRFRLSKTILLQEVHGNS